MKTLCINLDSRSDRKAEAQAEFDRVGLTVEFVSACTGDNPVLAFNKSVRKCMELAQGDDLLIFEDDVVFDKSLSWMPEIKGSYMTVHLGANIIGTNTTEWKMPTKYGDGLALLHNCWQSHATLYSAECVQYILDNFPYYKDEYEKEGCQIFDEWLRVNVLTQGRSYLLNPMIAYQRPSHSDIWNCPSDYTGCHKQGNEWLKMNL